MSPASASLLNGNTFVGSVSSSDNNVSFITHQQPSVKLNQSCMDEAILEMDSEDICMDNFIHSDRSSGFDASSALPLMNDSVSLNKRRRAILDLSISKMQTMNASNVAVSLRKSLLIYSLMKSLQRDLDSCDVFVRDNLIEKENVIIDNDVQMLETSESQEGNWKQPISNFNCIINNGNNLCNQHLDYDWPWGTLVNTSKGPTQDSKKYDNDNLCTLTNGNDLFSEENIWSNSESTDSSAFVDDYLGMLCAWEDESYNPLTNCNLTRAEIMNMFHLPSYHLNNQLVSQA